MVRPSELVYPGLGAAPAEPLMPLSGFCAYDPSPAYQPCTVVITLTSNSLACSLPCQLTALLAAVLDDQEETGWKYIHGDIFRFPPYRSLFCAFVGTGFQVLPTRQLPHP